MPSMQHVILITNNRISFSIFILCVMLGAYIHWMCMTSFFLHFLTSRRFHLAHHFTPYICHLLCDVYFPKPQNYILILFVVKCYVCIRLDFSLIITMYYFNSLKCTILYFNFELFFQLPQWKVSHSPPQQLFRRMRAHNTLMAVNHFTWKC